MLGEGRRRADTVTLGLGIGKLRIVFIPAGPALKPRGDFAPCGVGHFGAGSHTLTDAFQDAHAPARIAGVAAEMHVRSVRANHRNGLQFLEIKRQKVVLVFQEDHCFLGRA